MKIVYGTDGSECALVAGRLLAALPLPAGSEVTVLSAVRESTWAAGLPLEATVGAEGCIYDELAEIAAEEQAAARRTAEAAAVPLRERGLRVSVCVQRRRPATAILEQARAEGAHLIVVGSHGKGVMESFLLGSVSERVARYAHCSVLVARSDQFRRLVIGVDGSESAAGALERLADAPLPAGLELKVVHVVGPREMPAGSAGSGPGGMECSEGQRRAAGDRIIQDALERLRAAGRTATGEVRCGAPAAALVAAVKEYGADLLIVGATAHAGPGPFFLGSVSSRVLIHAPCSVLVARKRPLASAPES